MDWLLLSLFEMAGTAAQAILSEEIARVQSPLIMQSQYLGECPNSQQEYGLWLTPQFLPAPYTVSEGTRVQPGEENIQAH